MEQGLEKELKERNSQISLIQGYFDHKRLMLDRRQETFCVSTHIIVPTQGKYKFEQYVKSVSVAQIKELIIEYKSECEYWNSLYVLEHYNCRFHSHIMKTLKGMVLILRNFVFVLLKS